MTKLGERITVLAFAAAVVAAIVGIAFGAGYLLGRCSVTLRLLAATAPATTANDDLFGGVDDFFDSGTWLVMRNLGLFFIGVFWLASAYWVYKDARRRIEDPWLVAVATVLGLRAALRRADHLPLLPPAGVSRGRPRETARDQGDGGASRAAAAALSGLPGRDRRQLSRLPRLRPA